MLHGGFWRQRKRGRRCIILLSILHSPILQSFQGKDTCMAGSIGEDPLSKRGTFASCVERENLCVIKAVKPQGRRRSIIKFGSKSVAPTPLTKVR